jgi:hypothetical protein
MTLEEKLNMTQQNNYWPRVGEVDRLGYTGLYYADGSEGIRGLPFASAFDMALNGDYGIHRDATNNLLSTNWMQARRASIDSCYTAALWRLGRRRVARGSTPSSVQGSTSCAFQRRAGLPNVSGDVALSVPSHIGEGQQRVLLNCTIGSRHGVDYGADPYLAGQAAAEHVKG